MAARLPGCLPSAVRSGDPAVRDDGVRVGELRDPRAGERRGARCGRFSEGSHHGMCATDKEDGRLFLNAPEFLFISTRVAKKFPQLMESILVQSFFSHVPGELSKKWQVGVIARIHRYYRLRNVTILTTVLSGLQLLGTAPFIVHRMFVRSPSPFVFSALVLLLLLIASSPVFMALASAAVVGSLAYMCTALQTWKAG